jgi:hypothetical protein
MEAALKKEAIQKKDTELEAFLIDMQTTAGSNDEVQSEPEAEAEGPCTYLCLNRAGVIFNILLIIVLLIVVILICVKMMLEN